MAECLLSMSRPWVQFLALQRKKKEQEDRQTHQGGGCMETEAVAAACVPKPSGAKDEGSGHQKQERPGVESAPVPLGTSPAST